MNIRHLDLNTPDGAQLNMDALYQIAPSVFTESRDEKTGELKRVVNFDALRQLLGDNAVDESSETYEFRWVGKDAAKAEAARAIDKTLRPVVEDSVDWDTTKNLYIEGDNLEVLKLLQRSYMGKVKMIYIDPPYNTGNDFVYHDDFAMSSDEYEEASEIFDELGNKYVKNTETSGRFHSDWCNMMYSRLMIARSLLTDDGIIFISIDDNEVNNLRKIVTEIFGEVNFVAEMVWQGGKVNTARFISTSHEYIISFAKDLKYCSDHNVVWKEHKKGLEPIYAKANSILAQYKDLKVATEKFKDWFKNEAPEDSKAHAHYCNLDKKGPYCMDNVSRVGGGKYCIVNPINGLTINPPSRGWVYGKEEDFWKAVDEGILEFQDNNKLPILKRYLKDNELQLLDTVFYKDRRGAKIRLRTLLGGEYFDFPKDEEVLANLIGAFTKEDSIILDFFSGSGTTAHSTLIQNCIDNCRRKYIIVQLQEETPEDSESRKAGFNTIPDIAKERIRRAGKKIKEASPLTTQNLDTGFRVFRVDSSNFENVERTPKEYNQGMLDLFADNIKSDRSDLDLLFGSILAWGLQLDLPMETEEVDGCKIYTVNDGDLVACFAEKVTDKVIEAMAEKEPLRVLFRDSCFDSDDKKINLFETFKQKLDWTDDEAFNNIRVI